MYNRCFVQTLTSKTKFRYLEIIT